MTTPPPATLDALTPTMEALVRECRTVLGYAHSWQPLTPGDVSDLRRATDAADAALRREAPPAPEDETETDVYRIRVFREDDGQHAAEWETTDGKEAGMGNYSVTPVGALAELVMLLIKVEEDRRLEAAAPTEGEDTP